MTAILDRPTTLAAPSTQAPATVDTETFHVRAFATGQDTYRMSFVPVDGPARDSFVLRSHGEAAVALHVSGARITRIMTAEQVAAAIIAGVRAVGMAEVTELDHLERACNAGTARQMFGTTRAPWPHERERLCTDAVCRLTYAVWPPFTDSTPANSGPVVTVTVPRDR